MWSEEERYEKWKLVLCKWRVGKVKMGLERGGRERLDNMFLFCSYWGRTSPLDCWELWRSVCPVSRPEQCYSVHVGKIIKIKIFCWNFVKCFYILVIWYNQLFLNPGLNYRHFINDVIEVFKWVQGNCSTKRPNCVIVLLMIVNY